MKISVGLEKHYGETAIKKVKRTRPEKSRKTLEAATPVDLWNETSTAVQSSKYTQTAFAEQKLLF